jgi:chemotaxis regulatin CheY-phosphate phosphatase CheZ
MNKCNSDKDYEVARAQLDSFCESVGIDGPKRFVVPHDFTLMETCDHPIESLDGTAPLRDYLETLDVVETKAAVYNNTLRHFTGHSQAFIERLDEFQKGLQGVEALFHKRAHAVAQTYDPEPDAQVGKLLHSYIKARRGAVSRTVGNVGAAVYDRVAPVGKAVTQMVRSRLSLTGGAKAPTPEEVRDHHARELEIRTQDFIRDCVESAQHLDSPAREMLARRFEELDSAAIVRAVEQATLVENNISEAFRAHAEKTLDSWWNDNKMRRAVLVQLDALLMLAPTAVAVPLAVYSGGIGVPEVVAATSPLAGEFFARIMEHQFADKWVDLMAPWHEEQQARYEAALIAQVLDTALQPLAEGAAMLDGDAAHTLRRIHAQCLKVS